MYPEFEEFQGAVERRPDGQIESVTSLMYYCSQTVPRSLVRTGKVGINRATTGNDSGMFGLEWAASEKHVINARGIPKQLGKHGFELCEHKMASHPDYQSMESVVTDYYPEVEALVKAKTGASFVAAFDHNVRCMGGFSSGDSLKGGSGAVGVQRPLNVVPGDYTLTSAPARVQQLTDAPKVNDTFRISHGSTPLLPKDAVSDGRRFMLVNVWRNIREQPIERYPLAVADTTTVSPKDLVTFEIHYEDRIGENYFCADNGETHEWYYYPHMTRDEALLFKQWDSEGALPTGRDGADSSFCLHTAFWDPTTKPDSPDRASIEVRCVALF